MDKIRFRIWALQQDNLHRSDILARCKDPAHIATVTENMRKAEKEISELWKQLENEV